jgi:hypothetical protein
MHMAHLQQSTAALRIVGDDLDPRKVSKLLGSEPTGSQGKGQTVRDPKTGREEVARTGMWWLKANGSGPADLEKQVAELLGRLTQDMSVWASLSGQYKVQLTCDYSAANSNGAMKVPAETLLALGERGIVLDIGGPILRLEAEGPCPCGSGEAYVECCAPASVPL